MNHLRTAALAAVLFTAPVHAQDTKTRECPHGPADADGLVISTTRAAHPTRVASVMDSVLTEHGYTVLRAPRGAGQWQVEPRFTWRPGEKEIAGGAGEHPGVTLWVASEARADSTHVQIGARVICRLAGRGAKADELTAIQLMAAAEVTTALTARMDTLVARGVAMNEPVERPGRIEVTIPEALAGFALQGRHDYDDPRMGTNARYARTDGLFADVYVFPGPPADSSCPQACADDYVRADAKEFAELLPELIRRGQYRSASVTSDEAVARPAGAAWRAGRHLVARVDRGGEMHESHYYLFLFAGYQLKVRATFAPSDERRRAVQALVADALVKFAP